MIPTSHLIKTRAGRKVRALLVLATAASVVGCGGSHSGSTTPTPDLTISDLQVQAGPGHNVTIQVTFVDPDGDMFGGTCNVSSNLGSASIPINLLSGSVNLAATTGPIQCTLLFNAAAAGTSFNGSFSLTDKAGHVSNTLPFNTTIPERRVT